MKYQIPNDQDEILPNKLGLTILNDINISEFEGFLKTEIMLSEILTPRTKFNISLRYISSLYHIFIVLLANTET